MAITLARLEKHASAQSEKAQSRLAGKRVVIVDDSARQRAQFRSLLESLGLVCVGEAANGLECLSVVKRTQPDLVSLDVLMPVMHGVESLGYLRDDGYTGIVVFVSDLSRTEALAEVRVKGYQADAIFSKSDTKESFSLVLNDLFLSEEYRRSDIAQSQADKSA
jgi:CheY-like chemotaxis protein